MNPFARSHLSFAPAFAALRIKLIAAAVLLFVAAAAGGYGVAWYRGKQALSTCQTEANALLKQQLQAQALTDSVKFADRLAAKDRQLLTQYAITLSFQEKVARDSVQHLSELQALRAVNAYIERGRQRGQRAAVRP